MTQIRDVVLATIPSPCFVLKKQGLEQNLAVLNECSEKRLYEYLWLSRRSPSFIAFL